MIGEAMQAGLIREFDERTPLDKLCIQSLRELDHEGAFGTGLAREELIIGTACCELDFGEKGHVEELAALNPARSMSRLRQELAAAEAADRLLIQPR